MKTLSLGLDFGTSNTACSLFDGSEEIDLGRICAPSPSALYFFSESDKAPLSGGDAISEYYSGRSNGRLLLGIKSLLSDASFEETTIFGEEYTCSQLISILLHRVRAGVERKTGQSIERVVLGRPVRFTGDNDELALERLKLAARLAGFKKIDFEFEPVAAALSVDGLDYGGIGVVCDLGGGTSDFTVVKMPSGPSVSGALEREEVLGTAGFGEAGNRIDGDFVYEKICPLLGRDSTFSSWGTTKNMPPQIHVRFSDKERVPFLKSEGMLDLVKRIAHTSDSPDQLRLMEEILERNLGHRIHKSAESVKIGIETEGAAEFHEHFNSGSIDVGISKGDYYKFIEGYTKKVRSSLENLVDDCGLQLSDIDSVLMTGGTSLLRPVNVLMSELFPSAHVIGDRVFDRVAYGLGRIASNS